MTRLVLLAIAVCALAPAVAQDAPDCSVWSIDDLRPGMTFEEATASEIDFVESRESHDPPGYRHYTWQARDRPKRIELHVDVWVQPARVIGVMSTIPSAEIKRDAFLEKLIADWGQPRRKHGQGAFTLYTWANAECDVSARAAVMNQQHQVVGWVAINSNSARDEHARRKRESTAQAPAQAGAEGADANPAAAADPDADD